MTTVTKEFPLHPFSDGFPRLIKLDDELFVVSYYGFYVKAKVKEISYIHVKLNKDTNELEGDSIWRCVYKDWETDKIIDELDENPEKFENTVIVNQFPWTDWPTGGHAAYIGRESFFTLEEARKENGRFRKKGKYRRAKRELREMFSRVICNRSFCETPEEFKEFDHFMSIPVDSYYRKIYT